MNQSGQQLAREGAARAAEKADRMSPDWSELALKAVRDYALTHDEFTTEDVRLAAESVVPPAPDARAWGHIVPLAAKWGICSMTDRVARSKLPASHKRPLFVWKSNIYRVAA